MAPFEVSPKEKYLLPDAEKEVQRLTDHDAAIVYAMNNKRIVAPLDFSRPGLKILDSGTADGKCLSPLKTILPMNNITDQAQGSSCGASRKKNSPRRSASSGPT